MKAFLVLLVLLAAGYYYYFYRQPAAPPPVAETAKKTEAVSTPAPTPVPAATPAKQGFDKVTALLTQDLNSIPAPLDGPGSSPTNAITIRRGLASHEAARPEYQTLAKACDLILQADNQRASLQQACHAEQTRASFGGSLNGNSSMDHAVPTRGALKVDPAVAAAKAQAQIHSKYEASWNNYRVQTVGQVQNLLQSLAGKQL